MKLKFLVLCFLVVGYISSVGAANAQSSTGTIVGSVVDPDQRPIYNAVVTATQKATKQKVTTRTTHAGVYSFSGLDSGEYDISITAPNFGSEQVYGVGLEVGGSTTQDFKLKVGSQNDSITLNSGSEMLQRDSSSGGGTISQELTSTIPLPDQSPLGLVTLIPGVVGDPQYSQGVQSENPGIFTNPTIPGASLSIGGSRPGLVSQLIDGFDITQASYPRPGVSFTPGTIRGISVQFAGMAAEYGRTGGGIINQASAEGGQAFHGSLNYRHTDPGLGQAHTWNNPQRPDNHQTIYGGVISGPVRIPHLWGLKNTFFIFGYEPYRGRQVTYSRTRVSTPDELNGNLNNNFDLINQQVLLSSGYAAAIAAPRTSSLYYQYPILTPTSDGACKGTLFPCGGKLPAYNPNLQGSLPPCPTKTADFANYTAQQCPIPGNDVSAQVALNPLAQLIKKYYPTPATQTTYLRFDNAQATYDQLGQNAAAARGVVNHDDRWTLRVDHTFGNADHLFARYTIVPVYGLRFGLFGPDSPLNNIPTDATTSRNVAINYVHLFGPRVVNELRGSYIRAYRTRLPPPSALTQDYGAAVGLVPATNGVGFPAINFDDGLPSFGGGGGFQDGGRSLDSAFGFGNETTIVYGRHQIKFGGEYRALQLNRTDVSNTFGGNYTFASNETSGYFNGIGSPQASLDLGLINTFITAGSQPFYYRWKYAAGFIQDQWKIRSNLTFNYGLRYNFETPRQEKNNMQGLFDPNVQGILNGKVVTGGLVRSGTHGYGSTVFPIKYDSFEPRFGLSFSPKRYLVVKTAYALIHAPLSGVGNTILPTFAPAAQTIGPNSGGILNVPVPNGVSSPSASSPLDFISNPAQPISRVGAVTTTPDGNINQDAVFSYGTTLLPVTEQTNDVPYVEIWNLGFQVLAGKSTVLDATYVGQRALHLYSPALGTNLPNQAALLTAQEQHQNFNGVFQNTYGLGSESYLQTFLPYQQFYQNQIQQSYSRHSSSNYHGLYLGARQRILSHINMTAGLSWSKSMDNNSTASVDGTQIDSFGIIYPQNPYTNAGDYGVSAFDQPFRVTAGYNYDLPFGKGQPLFASHRILNYFIGGFSTSGYFSETSGIPLSITQGNNGYFLSQLPGQVLGSLGVTQSSNHLRPNIIPGVPIINPNWKYNKALNYINFAAFTTPGSRDNPQYGTARRALSQARSPAVYNWDISVRKNINITRTIRMQVYTDIQDVLNHPNFFLGGAQIFTGGLNAQGPTASGPFVPNITGSIPGTNGARIVNVGAMINF